jgi:hypothetical protein
MRYKRLFQPAELLDFDTGEWKEMDRFMEEHEST